MLSGQTFARWLPALTWPRLTRPLLRGELAAGVTVGLIVVPQAVAYGALAGMPVVTGIYAAFLPSLVAALFSASPRLSVGPTALSCLLVYASLAGHADPGSAQWVTLAVWLAALSGVMQILLGVIRFGWIIQLVSSPVLMGFTQAATLLIIGAQAPALLGLRGTGWAPGEMQWDYRAALFGTVSLVALILGKRLRPTFPTVLICVVGAGLISWAMAFGARGGQIIGHLPSGLPALSLPDWIGWEMIGELMAPALVITLVSFLETASSAKVDSQARSQLWDESQDLIAQGMAKLAAAASGCFATSSSFSRSALNLYAGAQTGWASLVTVGMVFVVLLWLTPALAYVPSAVLAAVVIAAVMGVMQPKAVVRLWRVSRVEACTAVLTFALTLLTAPRIYWGVLAGAMLSMGYFLYLHLHPRIVEVGLHADGSLRDRKRWNLPALGPGIYALRMDASLDFASANSLERDLTAYLNRWPEVKHVCLFAQPINHIDATGLECFRRIQCGLASKEITFHIAGLKLPVERSLRATGALSDLLRLRLYRTDQEALQALGARADADSTSGLHSIPSFSCYSSKENTKNH